MGGASPPLVVAPLGDSVKGWVPEDVCGRAKSRVFYEVYKLGFAHVGL